MMNIVNDVFEMDFPDCIAYKNLINFDNYFFIPDIYEKYYCFVPWAKKNNYKMTPCSHFFEDAHNDFVKLHMIPWLQNKKLIN